MVKLKRVQILDGSMASFSAFGNTHILTEPLSVVLFLCIEGKDHAFKIVFQRGYKCDGLSVPKIFRWFLPSWDKENGDYNLAGVIHDALYGNRGFCVFSREDCDDIFRGLLRESGVSRFKAGAADKAVELFANKHFGNDDLRVADLVKGYFII